MAPKLWAYRFSFLLFLAPILLLPIPLAVGLESPEYAEEAKCGYVVLLMAFYWMTEVIPLAITALIPVVLFPTMGIMKSEKVCAHYLKDINMLFVGGLMVAVAIEHVNLHKRIALRVLLVVGSKPRWLMLGFMLATWFLSMWISNTATTAMMIPIVQAVLDQLREHFYTTRTGNTNEAMELHESEDTESSQVGNGKSTMDVKDVELQEKQVDVKLAETVYPPTHSDQEIKREFSKLSKCMCLAVAYSASIGGIGTLTGTAPNLVMKGQMDDFYEKNGDTNPVNYGTWMAFGIPTSFLSLSLAWIYLQLVFFRCCGGKPSNTEGGVKQVIRKEYENLGSLTFAEIVVLIHFACLVLLWFFRHPSFIPGWGDLFLYKYVSDATPAVAIAISLFMVPSKRPNFLCCRGADDDSKPGPVEPILTWPVVHKGLPWSVVILLGGGFAMADGVKTSGLSVLVGGYFTVFKGIPPWTLVLVLCVIMALVTEVSSNTASATLMIPILAELATRISVHPLYIIFPATLAASFAFMLPAATPPNAIVFAYGHLKVKDMALVGIGMNIICLGVVTLATNTWGKAFFDLGSPPQWILQSSNNVTMTTASSLMTTQ